MVVASTIRASGLPRRIEEEVAPAVAPDLGDPPPTDEALGEGGEDDRDARVAKRPLLTGLAKVTLPAIHPWVSAAAWTAHLLAGACEALLLEALEVLVSEPQHVALLFALRRLWRHVHSYELAGIVKSEHRGRRDGQADGGLFRRAETPRNWFR